MADATRLPMHDRCARALPPEPLGVGDVEIPRRGTAAGRASLEQVHARIHGWLGHARHGATWRLRRGLLGEVVFVRASDHDVPGRRP